MAKNGSPYGYMASGAPILVVSRPAPGRVSIQGKPPEGINILEKFSEGAMDFSSAIVKILLEPKCSGMKRESDSVADGYEKTRMRMDESFILSNKFGNKARALENLIKKHQEQEPTFLETLAGLFNEKWLGTILYAYYRGTGISDEDMREREKDIIEEAEQVLVNAIVSKLPGATELLSNIPGIDADKVLEGRLLPTAQGQKGATLLDFCLMYNNRDTSKLLLKNLIKQKQDLGMALDKLLYYASINGFLDIVQELLSKETGTEWKNHYEKTALHFAAERGYIDIVNALIAAKADVNAQSYTGETALHLSAQKCHPDVVKALLEAGASVDLLNKKGHKALYYAAAESRKEGYAEVIELLLAAGADPQEYYNQCGCGRDVDIISYAKQLHEYALQLNTSYSSTVQEQQYEAAAAPAPDAAAYVDYPPPPVPLAGGD